MAGEAAPARPGICRRVPGSSSRVLPLLSGTGAKSSLRFWEMHKAAGIPLDLARDPWGAIARILLHAIPAYCSLPLCLGHAAARCAPLAKSTHPLIPHGVPHRTAHTSHKRACTARTRLASHTAGHRVAADCMQTTLQACTHVTSHTRSGATPQPAHAARLCATRSVPECMHISCLVYPHLPRAWHVHAPSLHICTGRTDGSHCACRVYAPHTMYNAHPLARGPCPFALGKHLPGEHVSEPCLHDPDTQDSASSSL